MASLTIMLGFVVFGGGLSSVEDFSILFPIDRNFFCVIGIIVRTCYDTNLEFIELTWLRCKCDKEPFAPKFESLKCVKNSFKEQITVTTIVSVP